MKLTTNQRRWYIDPIQDPLAKTESVLVTEERIHRGVSVDKIIKVTGRIESSNRVWWITEMGDHVMGAPVSASHTPIQSLVMGLLPGDVFVVGRYSVRRNDRAAITQTRRSDQLILPGTADSDHQSMATMPVIVKDWVRAAPWAQDLMPLPSDPAAVVNAKVALAEQRWKQRHAKAVFRSEAIFRDWEEKLEDLKDTHDLLDPTFGALFRGQVVVPLRTTAMPELSASDTEMIDALKSRAFVAEAPRRASVEVSMSLPLPVHLSNRDDLRKVSGETVNDQIRSQLNNYDASASGYTLTPVLRAAV